MKMEQNNEYENLDALEDDIKEAIFNFIGLMYNPKKYKETYQKARIASKKITKLMDQYRKVTPKMVQKKVQKK